MAQLAESFRKRCLEKGLSRKAVAGQSGVPVTTIARFEAEHRISLASYAALCKAFVEMEIHIPKSRCSEIIDEVRETIADIIK